MSLPPANKVWGKVICLHLSVILFTEGVDFPACITGHMTRKVCMGGVGTVKINSVAVVNLARCEFVMGWIETYDPKIVFCEFR